MGNIVIIIIIIIITCSCGLRAFKSGSWELPILPEACGCGMWLGLGEQGLLCGGVGGAGALAPLPGTNPGPCLGSRSEGLVPGQVGGWVPNVGAAAPTRGTAAPSTGSARSAPAAGSLPAALRLLIPGAPSRSPLALLI